MNLEQWEAIERWRIYHREEMQRVQRQHLIRFCILATVWLITVSALMFVVTS